MTSARTAKRLTLEGPRASMPRAVFLVEDALRTAALPGSERGLIIVRGIHLGDIPSGTSPMEIARRFESVWSSLYLRTVDAASPTAGQADVVEFTSEARMLALYLHRRAQGPPPAEWFWRKVLPAVMADAPESELLMATLSFILAKPAGGERQRVLAEFAAEVATFGSIQARIQAASEAGIRAVLHIWLPQILAECDQPLAPVDFLSAAPPGGPRQPSAPAPIRVTPRQLIKRALEHVASNPLLSSPDALTAALRRTLSGAFEPLPGALPPAARSVPKSIDTAALTPIIHAGSRPNVEPPKAVSGQTQLPAPIGPSSASAALAPAVSCTPAEDQPAGPPPLPAMIPTRIGGLYFAIAILRRIGFFDTSEAYQDEWLAPVLMRIAAAANATSEDPLLPGPPPPTFDAEVEHWLVLARRWSRRHARMLLNWIVRRAANVVITRTHIDIYFTCDQADIRIRRLGLDFDPGWLPALCKVVTFHYDSGDH